MKFLIDEDIPVKLLKELIAQGHDAVRVAPGSADLEIAQLAKRENRILITLDKDFSNTAIFPPAEFNIVQIRIHPPFAPVIISAFQKLLQSIPPEKFKGLLILLEAGNIRVSE